jgi:SAM-dependent methyltransferase
MTKHSVSAWQECIQANWMYPDIWQATGAAACEDVWFQDRVFSLDGKPGLNVGCGAVKIKGAVGVDLRPAGELGESGEKFNMSVAEISADATDIPLADSTQEFIVAAHVLEHLIDPFAGLYEWSRLLKPGGQLFMTLPDHDAADAMMVDYTHVHAYTGKSVRSLLLAAGFTVTSIENAPFSTIRVIARLPMDMAEVTA